MKKVRRPIMPEDVFRKPDHRLPIFPFMQQARMAAVCSVLAALFLLAGCGGGGGDGGGGGSNDNPVSPANPLASYCIDIYEASRPDATALSAGNDNSAATSREGVLPWRVTDNEAADTACRAAGKWLCTPEEWEYACRGPADTVYTYGDTYGAQMCNGLDTYGEGNHHMTPTGTFDNCTNGFGVFDMSGNVWEHTDNGDGTTVRGGAYNCYYPATRLRCDYVPGDWVPTALGFRCCKEREAGQCPADMVGIIPE